MQLVSPIGAESSGTVQRIAAGLEEQEHGLAIGHLGIRQGGPAERAERARQHLDLPAYASELEAWVAFAWPAMDDFYEEDERIVGHAADSS